MLTYDSSYKCHDDKLLKVYLFVLAFLHVIAAMVEVSIVFISSSGTIANSQPRKKISIPIYILTGIGTLEFAWDIVGVLWAFDPTIDCHKSHQVLLLTRGVLVWNFIGSVTVGLYLIMRIGKAPQHILLANLTIFLPIGICRVPCSCCCNPNKKLRYERLQPDTTYGGRRLSRASSETLVHHKRQRNWQWRVQCMFCCLKLRDGQKTAFADVAATLADAFNQFRGYVPSDIAAGLALYAFHRKIVT